MNKQEIVAKLHEKHPDIYKTELTGILLDSLDIIDEAVAGGEIVRFSGRTFKLVTRAARKGRNPRTGEVIDLPAKKVITYKKRI